MNILHINSYFSTSGLFNQMYNRQIESGLNIRTYVPISHQYAEERLATSGDYTTVSRTFNQQDRLIFPIKHRKILNDLWERYNFESIDLMHAHSLFSNGWLAWQVQKRYNIPYVVSIRNADARTFFERMPWMRRLGIQIMDNASEIVFISQNTYNDIFDRFVPKVKVEQLKDKSHVIANGIDDFWHHNRNEDKISLVHSPLRIVTAGKIMKQKRFVQLAEMTKLYSENFEPIELHIIGPSWDDKVINTLNNFDHVTYHGPKTKEEMLSIYREMDIFALLSYPETFGLVYAEAMSQGLPVIYTKGEGFDSFFPNHEVGVSVDKNDQIGFNQAVDYIYSHYGQMSQNCINNIHHFDWDKINKQYISLYQGVLS